MHSTSSSIPMHIPKNFGDINSQAIPCGDFWLDEVKEYRKGYETASWYKMIEVQPGMYPITTNGYWYFIELPGIVKKSYFPSSFGGMQYGSGDRPGDVGKEDSYHVQGYGYDLARLAVTKPDNYLLNKGWTVSAYQWGGPKEEDDFLRKLNKHDGLVKVGYSIHPPKEVRT